LSDTSQCHLALQMPHYTYFYGFGDSIEKAHASAALNALQFFNANVIASSS